MPLGDPSQGDLRFVETPPKPPFRATGQGLAIDNDFRPTEATANAILESVSAGGGQGSLSIQRFYLFVTRVATSWQLAGTTAQTNQSRSFYPRNLIQGDFTIEGVATSQAEYDRLVEFVQAHHFKISGTNETNPTRDDTANQTDSISFIMGQPTEQAKVARVGQSYYTGKADNAWKFGSWGHSQTYRHAPPIYWDVAITSMAAGHERFKFQPAFTLTCKVLNDRLQTIKDIEFDIMKNLDYEQIFGQAGNPTLPASAVGIDLYNLGTLVSSTQSTIHLTSSGAGTGGAPDLGALTADQVQAAITQAGGGYDAGCCLGKAQAHADAVSPSSGKPWIPHQVQTVETIKTGTMQVKYVSALAPSTTEGVDISGCKK